MARTPSALKIAPVHQHPNGRIHALSSDGRTVYVVRLGDTPSCTCPGFVNHGHCYHVATALCRYPAFYTAPWAVLVPELDPEPEPPAPAMLRPARCQAALYPDCDCPACRPAFAEAA